MRYIYLISCFFIVSISNAQNHDFIWLTGYSSNPIDSSFGGSTIDFLSTPPDIYYEYRDMYFYPTNASSCDSTGNLLFYTNGIYVANRLNAPMDNGNGLNPGAHADANIDEGYILSQGAMILPFPEHNSLYYLFHLDLIVPEDNEGIVLSSRHFHYTLIDMSKNGECKT